MMFDDSDEAPKVDRNEDGRWKKGTSSPNPRGYTKSDRLAREDVKEAARRLTPKALRTLERIMDNPKAPAAAQAQAAAVLLDRGWGKPETKAEVNTNMNYVARVPAVPESIEEWQEQNADLIAATTATQQ
jgi:hypothetical protein